MGDKLCTELDLNLSRRWATRHFARIGSLSEFYCEDYNFTAKRSNVYMCEETKILYRVTTDFCWKWHHYSLTVNLHSELFKCKLLVPLTYSRCDHASKCWVIHSNFVIYIIIGTAHLREINVYNWEYSALHCSPYIDDSVLEVDVEEHYTYLVLPWFDRFDRMNFWKFLTNLSLDSMHVYPQFISSILLYL
jgi:hypothetical protein